MTVTGAGSPAAARPRRTDSRRNERTVLQAAAAVFIASGVQAPIREIAAAAGVGTATIYRHFPTRADLVIAVYRHQVRACAEAGPVLLATGGDPYAALAAWVELFIDFLVTKRGLAGALHSDEVGLETLHAWFLETLVPVCATLVDAATASGQIRGGIDAYGLLRALGNLCIGVEDDPRYDARPMVALLVAGLHRTA